MGHQRSYVGQKRGRDEADGALDEKNALINLLMDLGNKPPGAPEAAPTLDVNALEEAVHLCKREISNKNETITELLLDCMVELSPKMPIYALLTGLINVEEPHWCADLLDSAVSMLNMCLSSDLPADHDRARLLLRMLCCLAVANVLQASACTGLLESMVGAATAAIAEGPNRHSWQPWSDWMVYCAVSALPWAGSEISASCTAELGRLTEAVDAYLEKRPVSFSLELKPFLAEIKEGDVAVRNDSGGASYISELWAAVKECAAAGWHVESIPQLLSEEQGGSQFSSRLALGQTHTLPQVTVPQRPAGLPSDLNEPHPLQVAASVQQAYPPHGGIRLLEPQHTDAGRPAIERFVAEDYIIDTLAAFDADRTQCLKRLVSGLMLPYNYTNLLSEVLFGQMLALPRPRLPSMAYCTIIVDMCRLPRLALPKPLSGCVRECFVRVPVMDPELRARLLTWLSYHLSNLENKWPWERWVRYVDEPEDNPYRQFCKELVARLVRLSWWDRVMQVLPPEFQRLLGPIPMVPLLPGQEDPMQQILQQQRQQQQLQEGASTGKDASTAGPGVRGQRGGEGPEGTDTEAGGKGGEDEEHRKCEDGGGEEGGQERAGWGGNEGIKLGKDGNDAEGAQSRGGQDTEMQEGGGEEGPPPSVDTLLAGECLKDVVRAKATPEALLEWMMSKGVEDTVGEGPLGPVKVLMRALLAAGSKSPTHLNVALERYAISLRELMSRAGLLGQMVCVELAAQFYAALPQKVLMVLDRMIALGLVGAEALSNWAFETAIPVTLSKQASASSAWEVLHYALERSAARLPEAEEKIGKALGDLDLIHRKMHALQERAENLADQLRAYAAQQRQEQQDAGYAGGTRDLEGVPLEELAINQHSRKLLAGQRDALHRASVFAKKAEALTSTLSQHQALREAAGPGRDLAMITAYRGFLQLVIAEEESASSHGMGVEGEEHDTTDRTGEIHQARLDHLYAQLRAFVRKYMPQTAAIAPQLSQELKSRNLPPRALEVLQEVLKCEL